MFTFVASLVLSAFSHAAPVAPLVAPPTTQAQVEALVATLGAPAAASDPCYDALKAALAAADQWERDCVNVPIPGPVPCIDWPGCCNEEGNRRRAWAWWSYWNCLGFDPGPPPAGDPPSGTMAGGPAAIIVGIALDEGSSTYNPCSDHSPGYDEWYHQDEQLPNCSGFRIHDPGCMAPKVKAYHDAIDAADVQYQHDICICLTYLYVDPPAYEQCKADAETRRNRAWENAWATFEAEAETCCVEVTP